MENPFTQLLTGLFKKKEESVIGIDLGAAFIKVVQLRKKGGRAVLETYGELALGPYGNASLGQATNLPVPKIAEALTDLFRESNVTTKSAAVSLPLGASLLAVMELPEVDEKQLARMIPIEARKYIPVPISEVNLDWWIVPRHEGESGATMTAHNNSARRTIDVLVVAVHNDVVIKHRDIASSVSLEKPIFELEVFSTARGTFGNQVAPTMILDMGAGSTKLAIVEFGIIKAQHIVNRGSQDITFAISQSLGVSIARAEQLKRDVGLLGKENDKKASDAAVLALDHIFSEASRVLLNYERRFNRPVKNVLLAGGGVLLKGFFEKAEEHFSTTVTYADPFSKVEAPAFLEPLLKDAGPEFAVAVGLALRKLQELQ